MTTTKAERERKEAADRLRLWVNRGDTIYTVLRHVSRSGMLRVIDAILFTEDKDSTAVDGLSIGVNPLHLGRSAAVALGWTYDADRDGVRIGGAGMDMGFHLVYELSYALFDGDGYALNHRWL